MQRTFDTRLRRAAKAKGPRDLAAARQRTLLRARAAITGLLRERFAAAFEPGDAAAAELAAVPDTPELRRLDAATLARDHAGVEERFAAHLLRLVRQYHDGRVLDRGNASPAELVAARLAQTAGG
jgi:hypothetical protein